MIAEGKRMLIYNFTIPDIVEELKFEIDENVFSVKSVLSFILVLMKSGKLMVYDNSTLQVEQTYDTPFWMVTQMPNFINQNLES